MVVRYDSRTSLCMYVSEVNSDELLKLHVSRTSLSIHTYMCGIQRLPRTILVCCLLIIISRARVMRSMYAYHFSICFIVTKKP